MRKYMTVHPFVIQMRLKSQAMMFRRDIVSNPSFVLGFYKFYS